MNRDMVLAEWRRASQSLRAAQLLARDRYYEDAVSRAYYAILHAAKAALYVHDVAADSHAAVKRMFGLHLIRPGKIEAEWSAYLVESLDDRLAADYDAQASFSKRDAAHECRRARGFLNRIRQYLLTKGFRDRELRTGARDG